MWGRLRKVAVAAMGALTAGALWSGYDPQGPPPRQAPAPPPAAKPAGEVRPLPTPDDAVRLALQDADALVARGFPEGDLRYVRYVWAQRGGKVWLKTTSLTLAFVGRGSGIARPVPVADGTLCRVDLRLWAPRDSDLEDWLRVWEGFAFDPTFAKLVTKDTLDFEAQFRRATEGLREELSKVDVIRVNPVSIDGRNYQRLQSLLHTEAPVVEEHYLKYRALRQIQENPDAKGDDVVYKTVWGGDYYALRGIKRAKDVLGKDTKVTDQQFFFDQFLGVGNVKGGLNAEALFDRLRSDMRALKFRSGVTGKTRVVSVIPTLADKEGGGKGSITFDIKDRDVDIGSRSYARLLKPFFRAQEGIFPPFAVCVLFNDQGALQDEVPPDVATDRTIPEPYTQRLQPFDSCMRCHCLRGGRDFWQPVVNDAKKLLGGRLDVFGDLDARRREFEPDTFDRLAGLYGANYDKAARRLQDDYAEAVLKATGPWEDSADQADVGKLSAEALAKDIGDYWYETVTPRAACRELGYDVPQDPGDKQDARALEFLREILPPDPRALAVQGAPQAGRPFVRESPALGALKEGIPVLRSDWDLVKSYAAERVREGFERRRRALLEAR